MKVSKFVAKIMGKSQSKLKQKQLDRLQGETKFSREELQDLYTGIIEMRLPFVVFFNNNYYLWYGLNF